MKQENLQQDSNHNHDVHHEHSINEELMHHFPYAIFSVAIAMIILSLLDYTSRSTNIGHQALCSGYHMLFHSFHFLHILFAATGIVVSYTRYVKNSSLFQTLLVCTITPTVFCILSDIIFPYIAGILMGVHMELHICFYSELQNILPFLLVGIINGFVLAAHHSSMLRMFSLGSHFTHIFISSLASLFYMVAHGFHDWYPSMGYLFLLLVIAIVIPCTFSDIIVPMYFAGNIKNEK